MKDKNNNTNNTNVMTGSLPTGGGGLGRGGNPLQNDATTCAPLVGEPKSLISKGGKNRLDCFAFARNDAMVEFEDNECNKILKRVQDDNTAIAQNNIKDKKCNELINLSTYRLIDLKKILRLKPQNDAKNVKTLVPECPSALIPPKKKAAFTLAETFITLGIIGIVAAMTIPTLMAKYQQRSNAIKWRKAFTTLNQATKLIQEADEAPFFQKDFDNQDDYEYALAKLFAKYLKTGSICHTKKYVEEGCAPKTFPIFNYDGTENASDIGLWGGGASCLSLLSGELMCFDARMVLVDVNGYSKPNTIGKDVFFGIFDFDNYTIRAAKGRTSWGAADGVLVKPEQGDGTCQKTDGGYGCSYYYLNNLP